MPLGFLKRALAGLGIYSTAKRWYQRIWNRSEYERFKRDLESLSPMIPSGSLVIDVGANQGSLVERYLALGARVVAVEPNPGLADLLRQRHPSVEVVQAAVGAAPGRATLHICSQDTHSTLSDRRVDHCVDGRDADLLRFEEDVEVEITTLDQLIEQNGVPSHIKVDVEGFEDRVFAGLSQPVASVCFEYNSCALDITERVVDKLAQLGRYQFECTRCSERELVAGGWTDPAGIKVILARIAEEAGEETYGDVFGVLAD